MVPIAINPKLFIPSSQNDTQDRQLKGKIRDQVLCESSVDLRGPTQLSLTNKILHMECFFNCGVCKNGPTVQVWGRFCTRLLVSLRSFSNIAKITT